MTALALYVSSRYAVSSLIMFEIIRFPNPSSFAMPLMHDTAPVEGLIVHPICISDVVSDSG